MTTRKARCGAGHTVYGDKLAVCELPAHHPEAQHYGHTAGGTGVVWPAHFHDLEADACDTCGKPWPCPVGERRARWDRVMGR